MLNGCLALRAIYFPLRSYQYSRITVEIILKTANSYGCNVMVNGLKPEAFKSDSFDIRAKKVEIIEIIFKATFRVKWNGVCQCRDNSSPLKLIGKFSRENIGCKTRVKFVNIHSVSSKRFHLFGHIRYQLDLFGIDCSSVCLCLEYLVGGAGSCWHLLRGAGSKLMYQPCIPERDSLKMVCTVG